MYDIRCLVKTENFKNDLEVFFMPLIPDLKILLLTKN